jgi:anti-anti-sigma factor
MAELDGDPSPEVVIDIDVDPSGASIVSVSGELDISTAGKLQTAVESVIDKQSERVIFDFSELRFMDSAGIAVLVGAAAKLPHVHLRNPSPAVRRIVEITGLSDVLPIES